MNYNKYYISDAIDIMARIRPGTIKGIATSPPYNKKRAKKISNSSNWKNSKLMKSGYDTYDDNMAPAEYVEWQKDFLHKAVELVGDEGIVVYNIGRDFQDRSEDPRRAIVGEFNVRQTVIWNRGSSNQQGGHRPVYFPPIYELVYLIAGKDWRLPARYLREFRRWGDVWSIPFEKGTEHPAPYPLELALRMVKCIDGPVLDPFAGSGTTGIAAARLGHDFILADLSRTYKQLFEARLQKDQNTRLLPFTAPPRNGYIRPDPPPHTRQVHSCLGGPGGGAIRPSG